MLRTAEFHRLQDQLSALLFDADPVAVMSLPAA
jgi:hypothetical protein